MTDHTDRFSGRVAEYDRYRIRYPAAVLDILRDRCKLTRSSVIADVGAGTGMLAELFLGNGNRVFAIEPNAPMRAVCDSLRAQYEQLSVVDAAAEATTLDDASVDFVTAGRAFHWFDRARALPEFRRILRPQGWLVLVANGRGRGESEQEIAYERLLAEEGVDHQGIEGRLRLHDVASATFAAGTFVQMQLDGEQRLTLEEFLGQTQSYSSAPLPGDAKYEGMQRALHQFFAQWQKDGLLRMRTTCLLTCGQL
jgi:SAM-dependent methyltransferase